MELLAEIFKQFISFEEFSHPILNIIARVLYFICLFVIVWFLKKIISFVLLKTVYRFIRKTKHSWDDYLIDHRFFETLLHLVPIVFVYPFVPLIFSDSPLLVMILQRMLVVTLFWCIVRIVNVLLSVLEDVSSKQDSLKDKPVRSYVQVLRILSYFVFFVVSVSVLFSKSPWGILSGIGALMAVVLLVFKDSILGFVASIQISSYDLVRKGDWIEMSQFNADGDVIDISLNLIKVQNWDKTISAIPTYSLISGSFKNWRGMQNSGGRRIKRSVYIDMTSVKLCSKKMLQKFSNIDLLQNYITDKEVELKKINNSKLKENKSLVNLRQLTNLGTFRVYIEEYLKQNLFIRKDMTLLVRQLDPTNHGIPIEIYCFTDTTAWALYEKIQSDIFDHILSVVEEFDLRVFQSPTGYSFTK
ncbi:mechanosensitive ion channel [Leptospira sp. 96542]|nr:mechanosensitive ion channel [Leptospira sp. 96542]